MKGPMQTVFFETSLCLWGNSLMGYAENAQTMPRFLMDKRMKFLPIDEMFQ